MSLARFGVLVCVIVSCGCLLGQSAVESTKTRSVDNGNPRQVSGRVIDDLTGKPIIGAKVQLSIIVVHSSCARCRVPPRPPEQPPTPRSMITGDGGKFTFDDVPPRMINVAASKSGYLTAWPIRRRANDTLGNFETVHGSVDSIVIRLAPEATVTGVLRHHDGTPVTLQPQIAMMRVRSWAGFPRVEPAGWPKYKGDGGYVFGQLPPGCFYLIASVFRESKPERFEGRHAFGEVPVRYPALSAENPNPCFTLREGEHLALDLPLPEKEFHRVTTVTLSMGALSVNILDEGGGYYRFHELPPDNKCEAWLPDGRYWLDIGRPGGILGPTPFRVNGEELSDIDFTIEQPNSTWMKVPVELSRSSPGSATDKGSVRSCGFVNAYFVRFDRQGYAEVGDNLLLSVPGEPCGAHKPATASMVPGEYTLVAEMSGPNYVKAIKSGNFDLSDGPLKVLPGQIPEMIRIELAEGGGIKGSLQFEGKPAKAFVYTLPLEIASKTDFRLFGSVFAKEDGTFEISGLAPGSYRVFASNVELELNKAHLAANAFWLAHGKKIDVLAGETTEVELTAFEPQYEP